MNEPVTPERLQTSATATSPVRGFDDRHEHDWKEPSTAPKRRSVVIALVALLLAGALTLGIVALVGGSDDGAKPTQADELVGQGVLMQLAGKNDDARRYFEQALDLEPGNTLALYNLGQIAQAAGDLDGALARYQAAIAADPTFGPALFGAGLVAAAKGDLASAVVSLRKSLEQDPASAAIKYQLALALIASGQDAEGTALLNEAFTADPTLVPKV